MLFDLHCVLPLIIGTLHRSTLYDRTTWNNYLKQALCSRYLGSGGETSRHLLAFTD